MISSIHLPKPKRRSSSSLQQEVASFVADSSISDGYESEASDVTEVTSNTGNLSGPLSRCGGGNHKSNTTTTTTTSGLPGPPGDRSVCRSTTNATHKSSGSNDGSVLTRWSSGDAIRPMKRGIQVLKRPSCCDRRHSGSTSSTTSHDSSINSDIDDDNGHKPQEEDCEEKDLPTNIAEEKDKNTPTTSSINNTNKEASDHQGAAETDDCVEEEDDDDQHSCSYDLKSKPGYINVREEDEDDIHDDEKEDNFELLLDGDDHHEHNNHHSYASPCHQSHSHHSASGACAAGAGCASSASVGGASCSSSGPCFVLTEERVRAHMKDYYEDFDSIFRHGKSSEAIWDSFFKQYYTKDILWVRSSSNTLKGPELAHHFANDIEGIRMQLVCIDNIQLLGMTAIVVFTADQEFLYRGHPVSDRTVLTMVLHVDSSLGRGREKIRIAHEHRCVGKPIPKNTRWGNGGEKC